MLVLLGANHRSAPVEWRERIAFSSELMAEALARLLSDERIDEGLILSTCNRVEILVQTPGDAQDGIGAIRRLLAANGGIDPQELKRYSYRLEERDAVRHLMRVASGLDSMILGEPQILGQVKEAYRTSKQHGATGPVLERLMQHTLAAAKRVRTETGISRNAVSVAYAAVQLAKNIFGELGGRSALLLGSGKMSELVARHLRGCDLQQILVSSRNYNHAVDMARRTGGRAAHWDDGLAAIADIDIVVTCTAASRPILSKKDIGRTLRKRHGQPLFLIDIAVPRDVEPAVNQLDNVYLYDIDGLQSVVDSNHDERKRAASDATQRIDEEVTAYERWQQSQAVTPLIISLREALMGVGRAELERALHRLELSNQQEQGVERLLRSVIQKILHRPIRHLRGSVDRGDMQACEALYRELFGIGDPQPDPQPDDGSKRLGPQRILKGGKES